MEQPLNIVISVSMFRLNSKPQKATLQPFEMAVTFLRRPRLRLRPEVLFLPSSTTVAPLKKIMHLIYVKIRTCIPTTKMRL